MRAGKDRSSNFCIFCLYVDGSVDVCSSSRRRVYIDALSEKAEGNDWNWKSASFEHGMMEFSASNGHVGLG